ncbi:MAG: helix-turn-helix domain-containing protein [Planctomycetota bacterium]
MADKMFYTLEETAQKLGKSEQEVRDLASSGELKQYRDRDKLMFKVEDVDGLGGGGASADDSIGLELSDTGTTFDLADTGLDASAMDASAEMTVADTSAGDSLAFGDSSIGTAADSGVDVFSPGEVDAADPLEKTQVTSSSVTDAELQLDSVGSGSGLLDLTRESDETSLGAELDEIFPGGDTAAGGSAITESAVGSSGVFDTGMAATGTSGATAMESAPPASGAGPSPMLSPRSFAIEEEIDGPWSGFTTGAMIGAMVTLIVGLIVAAGAVGGVSTALTSALTGSTVVFFGAMVGLFVLAMVLGVIGMVIGKASAN